MKLQHIKGIANILADSVSNLKTVGLYHDLDLQHSRPELSTPFRPLLHRTNNSHLNNSRQKSHQTSAETLGEQFTVAQIDSPDTPLGDISAKDETHIEHKLTSLPKLDPQKSIQLQKDDTFCGNIFTYLHCSKLI